MTRSSQTVAFRLTQPDHQELTRLARQRKVSVHELAREMTVSGLTKEDDSAEMSLKLSVLQEQLKELRTDFSVAVEALLVLSGKVTKEEVTRWVSENLSRH
jgi:hypothetical protein